MKLKLKKDYRIKLSQREFDAIEKELFGLQNAFGRFRKKVESDGLSRNVEMRGELQEIEERLRRGILGQLMGYFDTIPF